MGISTFNPDVYLLLRSRGSGVPVLVYLLFLLQFALFPIISFVSLLPTPFKYHGLPIC